MLGKVADSVLAWICCESGHMVRWGRWCIWPIWIYSMRIYLAQHTSIEGS